MDKSKTIEGIIISRKDIGEADRLLTVFSKDEGKIKIIARGTRRLKSKNASHIEPFTIGKYSIVPGKTFYVLTGAESTRVNYDISGNLEKYNKASYLVELVDIAGAEGLKMPRIYNLLKNSLEGINNNSFGSIDARYFEFILLSELGYHPNYQKCQKCGKDLDPAGEYRGSFEGVECSDCKKDTKIIENNLLKILRLMENGNIEKVKSIKGVESYGVELKSIITDYLYTILPRLPKSGRL